MDLNAPTTSPNVNAPITLPTVGATLVVAPTLDVTDPGAGTRPAPTFSPGARRANGCATVHLSRRSFSLAGSRHPGPSKQGSRRCIRGFAAGFRRLWRYVRSSCAARVAG